MIKNIVLNNIQYFIHIDFSINEGAIIVMTSFNEKVLDIHLKSEIINGQTFKFHIDSLIVGPMNKIQENDLIYSSLLEFLSIYCFQYHKDKDKAPVLIIENATGMYHTKGLPFLQFYPARDQIYISSYNPTIESEWVAEEATVNTIKPDLYINFFKKTLIPKHYFLNEELSDFTISGIILSEKNNYTFNHNEIGQKLQHLSIPARANHYKSLVFPLINMDEAHPPELNAKVLNIKNINNQSIKLSGHYLDISNVKSSKIHINLEYLGAPPKTSFIYLEKVKTSQLKIYQKRFSNQEGIRNKPFVFLKNCKHCDISMKSTTFFIIADSTQEKYENRSIIVDASADDLYHKIIYLTKNNIEFENKYKQNISWAHMEHAEQIEILKAFNEIIPILEDRYKMQLLNVKFSIENALENPEYIKKLKPQKMSFFLRNIRNLDSDYYIE